MFQPRKVDRSGLWQAFDGHVLIYIHKEAELDDVVRLYPARHYVMIDDKLRILDSMKKAWGDRLTAVFPRQGHYAKDPEILSRYPHGDVQTRSYRRPENPRACRPGSATGRGLRP